MRLVVCIFVACWSCLPSQVSAQTSSSHYVPMDDGIRLAVDVHYPSEYEDGKRYPAVMELTRYWRGMIDGKSGEVLPTFSPIDKAFLEAGYVLVKVDVRGSGASFGHRMEEYGPTEVKDGYALVDWVSRQSWSDGNVGAKGISYTGTTAELLAASNHPALKAVIPGWSDFDVYASPGRPYGLLPAKFLQAWGTMVGFMDSHNGAVMGGDIRPVDPSELSSVLKDHERNPDVFQLVKQSEFRDVGIGPSAPLGNCTSIYWRKETERSKVPMLVFASWLDAGTADGALIRLQNYSNPQKVVILASNHGGRFHASPFTVERKTIPTVPSFDEQIDMRLAFCDHYLKGEQNGVADWPALQYFNMNEEKMKSADSWPVSGVKTKTLYLSNDNRLDDDPPENKSGSDAYEVDFSVGTGGQNRWMTQMGGPVLNLHNRDRVERRLLTYTSEPFEKDLQLTGSIVADLTLASSDADAAVLVYVSVIDAESDSDKKPNSRYLTEGGIRLLHRKVVDDPDFVGTAPYHSFRKSDAMDMEPGQPTNVQIRLWPTSVLIRKGQRLRFSIAGQDDDVFERFPAIGNPSLTLFRNSEHISKIELPVINQ